MNETKIRTNGKAAQGARSKRLSRAAIMAQTRAERARFEVRGAAEA